ncbi:three-Cys-motif partner protein TcmP [Methylobacillus sp.]|uniref:three-Cys-motif partner protein TcmP n=1 Tax=Methylobacillus sp. TaxID=56818 RepID=UPI002FE34299
MVQKHYDYANTPLIDYHSTVKHKILRDYIKQYVATLTQNIKIDSFKIAIVDGFAGSGRYTAGWDSSKIVYGSPFTILEACQDAQRDAQSIRHKPFKLDAKFYFVEKDSDGFNTLKQTLIDKGYSDRINNNQDIWLFHDYFENKVRGIIDDIKHRSKRARSLFLLDQYGYSEVPRDLIKYIFNELPGAEILLTFHVDSLLKFLNEKNLKNFHKKTGFSITHLLDSGLHDKNTRPEEWRLAAQAILHQDLIRDCLPNAAGHHTTFYIRGINGLGDYWLVHLSRNITARNVMVDIHWTHGNHFVHYGGAGLDMYSLRGYNTNTTADMYGFCKDAKALTLNTLQCQLPKLIHDHYTQGISFKRLITEQANYTPATEKFIRETFCTPEIRADILIVSKNGKIKSRSGLPKDTDLIIPKPQKSLFI